MKNILKNLSGGFFRTFGRVLFYIVLGLIVGYFFKSNGLKITDLIGFTKVNASTIQNWDSNVVRFWYDDHGTEGATSWQNDPYYYSPTLPVTRVQWGLKTGEGFNRENSYTFQFGYKPVPDAITVSSIYILIGSDTQTFSCTNWEQNQYGYYLTTCSFSPSHDYTNSDYLYVIVYFNQAYLTQIVSYMAGYDERLGTNAVITDSTNQIINNANTNTQNIINNINNGLTNATNSINNGLNALTDSQKVCNSRLYYYRDTVTVGSLSSTGAVASGNTNWGITDYIEVDNTSELSYIDGNSASYVCFYDSTRTVKSCYNAITEGSITIPTNTYYVRFSIRNSDIPKFTLKTCKNGNQALTDALTDDSSPDISSLNDMAGWLPAGPLDSILNLPLTLLNSLTTALSGTCSPITLTLPYISEDLTLPCISSIYQSIGAITFVNWIGTIASAFILFKYLMKLYQWVDDTLTFRENNWLDNWGGVD